ncbi:MAG: V-type ATPase subunit [Chloroflexi bacterium]|nr:V-type ATPase subunit [Chloroflexota bacterium]
MVTGLESVRYAAPNARIRAFRSRLLSTDVWRTLITIDNLAGAVDILQQTDYRRELGSFTQDSSLEIVENRLTGRAARNVREIMAITSGTVRNLFMVWWQHYELENLKSVFRGVQQHLSPDAIRRLLVPLDGHTTLPWDSLMHEQSISSLIERLDGTHYINPLRNASAAYQRAQSLFPLEIALDIRYYRDVATAVSKLKGEDLKEARRVLGTRIDILNILWAFRHRVYYGLSAEEIVNYTLWHTFRTDTNLVREIALGADPRDIIRREWGDAVDLSIVSDMTEPIQMMPWLEIALERFWRKLALNEMSGYPFKLGAMLGYLVLSELEIHDLVTLLEGKGMNWPPERIQQNLIWVEE